MYCRPTEMPTLLLQPKRYCRATSPEDKQARSLLPLQSASHHSDTVPTQVLPDMHELSDFTPL